MFEGASTILEVLSSFNIKGSFFFTGNYLRLKEHEQITKRIIDEGHYVGAHSDKHLLYATWENRNESLVSRDSLLNDIKRNYRELARLGIVVEDAPWFLPPYEWYNRESVYLASLMGLKTINYTPGTATPADYTTPDMKNYKSSDELIDALMKFEEREGLNGAFILIHPGTEESRTDKLYDKLELIISELKEKGYRFDRL